MNPLSSSRRTLALGAVAVLAGSTLLALPAAAQEIRNGGTLVVGVTQAPRHLNGGVQSGVATAVPSTQLFASPLRFDDQWNPQPYLAESWKLSDDGKALTLNLRKNAVFHDGKPVTSADVAFSIMVIKANHPFSTMLAPVEKVETPDPATAIIRMSTPHPAIMLAMSPALAPIMPKHVYGDGTDLKDHPRNSQNLVGSGPFKLVEFRPGQRVVMEKFDRFFLEGKPHLDKIILTISPDTQSLLLDLERGDIQMQPYAASSVDLRRLKNNPNIQITAKGYEGIGSINWLAFNTAKKPLDDVRVRKAIAHAVDKNFIARALMGGFATVSDGPIVPGSPYASTDLVKYAVDLKKSAELLDLAGHGAGAGGERFKLTIDYLPGNDEQQKNVAEYLRSQLKKVGITVAVRASADFPAWSKRIASHDFDMTMDTVFNWGDPVIGVHRTYLSSNIKPIIWTNTQSYQNPKVDELLDAAGVVVDPARRKADYAAFQKIVTDEVPIVFINLTPYHTVSSRKVGNTPATIWGPASPMDDVFLQ